jgi:hypothetical protein
MLGHGRTGGTILARRHCKSCHQRIGHGTRPLAAGRRQLPEQGTVGCTQNPVRGRTIRRRRMLGFKNHAHAMFPGQMFKQEQRMPFRQAGDCHRPLLPALTELALPQVRDIALDHAQRRARAHSHAC